MATAEHYLNLVPQAVNYYERLGYIPVTVPQAVRGSIMNATAPEGVAPLAEDKLHLIASGEQGLVEELFRGTLSKGAYYQTTTMCFRPGDAKRGPDYLDAFLKVELLCTHLGDCTRELAANALGFYAIALGNAPTFKKTEIGVDIMHKGVELGSYGCRSYLGVNWTYGTGYVPFRTAWAAKGSPPPC